MSDHRDPCRVFEVDDGESRGGYEKRVAREALKTRLWQREVVASRLQQRRWQWGRLKSWPRDPGRFKRDQNNNNTEY